jgi:hypothetical protein
MTTTTMLIGGDVDVTPGIVVLPDVVSDVGGERPNTGDAESDISEETKINQ